MIFMFFLVFSQEGVVNPRTPLTRMYVCSLARGFTHNVLPLLFHNYYGAFGG